MVQLAPVVLALLKILGRLERPGFEVQDEHVPAQLPGVARLGRKLELGQVAVVVEERELGLIGRDFEGGVEQPDDLADGDGRLVVADGPARQLDLGAS